MIVLGHTKLKTIKEQGMTEEQEFQMLDSNLNADYANIVAHKADVVATINIEREINDAKRVTDAKRYIYFRNNGFINAGSRFSNIVDRVELSAENFIKAIEDAIKGSMTTPISDEELAKRKQEELIENKKKADEFIAKQKANNEYTLEEKQEKLDKIKTNLSKIDMAKLQKIMADNAITSFNDTEAVPSKAIDEILALI